MILIYQLHYLKYVLVVLGLEGQTSYQASVIIYRNFGLGYNFASSSTSSLADKIGTKHKFSFCSGSKHSSSPYDEHVTSVLIIMVISHSKQGKQIEYQHDT